MKIDFLYTFSENINTIYEMLKLIAFYKKYKLIELIIIFR